MKTTKRLLPYLVLLVLTLSLRYCINNSLWESKYVAFSSMPFEEKTPEPIALRSFEIPDSLWADTGTRLHYDTLSSEDQTVYRLLEYARDQRMTHLFLDQRLLDGTSRSIGEILTLFSMDSPLVEQNLDHRISNSSIQSPVTGKAVWGKLVVVEQFSQEYWEKKMMALEKARSIVANILANKAISNTPIETARYFYTFLTQGTDYSLYGEDQTPHYLYDALVAKKTQCDGYANAFSLLCNLAGIPCFEKIFEPEEGAGHTWNCFRIGEAWYNADCALSDEVVEDERRLHFQSRFAFSDALQDQAADYGECHPVCTEDLIPLSLVFKSGSDPDLAKKVSLAFQESKEKLLLISTGSSELSGWTMQKLSDTLKKNVYCVGFCWHGENYYFIFVSSPGFFVDH